MPHQYRSIALGTLALCLTAAPARARLLVDDFEDGDATNALGGPWMGFSDGYSTSTGFGLGTGRDSGHAGHLAFTVRAGAAYPYVGLATYLRPDSATTGIDLGGYEGLRFWARGNGTFSCQVATSRTAAESNHFGAVLIPTPDWRRIEIPFASLVAANWGSVQPWDPTTVYALQWVGQDPIGTSDELFIDDLELYAPGEGLGPEPPVVFPTPKVNQVGYYPDARKLFVIVASSAQPGDAFSVNDAATGASVLTGAIAGPIVDDTPSSGEEVVTGDFSALAAPGRYVVNVNGQTSPTFEVGEHVYDLLLRDALRAFGLIRCGVAVDDAETGVRHAACHQHDAPLRSDPTRTRDLVGGWHNAGYFGKWAHMAAISAAKMMWAWELNPGAFADLGTGIPAGSPGLPDILQEARWGLEWLTKLQQEDGSVIHKVDTEPNFAWGLAPESDPNQRWAAGASSIDAAVAAAALAQAERVFGPSDGAFADRCRQAAERAFDWVEANPAVAHNDPYYVDSDPSQEITWALGERSRAKNDPALRARFAARLDAQPLGAVSWSQPELLGYLAVAEDPNATAALKAAVAARITRLGESLAGTIASTGYRVATAPAEYFWGSNEVLLDRAVALVIAAMLSGQDEYRLLALEELDWILGKNPLDRSYVTGFGTRSVEHPYHWISYALGKAMPGWATGGPNQYAEGADPALRTLQAAGTPPAKCYLDLASSAGSAASNEGQTTENAALVLLTGLLARAAATPVDAGKNAEPSSRAAGAGCGCAQARRTARGRYTLALFGLALLHLVRRRGKRLALAPGERRYRQMRSPATRTLRVYLRLGVGTQGPRPCVEP